MYTNITTHKTHEKWCKTNKGGDNLEEASSKDARCHTRGCYVGAMQCRHANMFTHKSTSRLPPLRVEDYSYPPTGFANSCHVIYNHRHLEWKDMRRGRQTSVGELKRCAGCWLIDAINRVCRIILAASKCTIVNKRHYVHCEAVFLLAYYIFFKIEKSVESVKHLPTKYETLIFRTNCTSSCG